MTREADETPARPARPKPDDIDEASQESFPASDPPSTQPLHVGTPGEHPDHQRAPANDDRRG